MSRRKSNRTGRSKGSLTPFVALERYILNSAAWRSLKPMARAAYVEIASAFDGRNNGKIALSARQLGEALGVDKATASRAISELQAHGFIETARRSSFTCKVKLSAEYRLTAYRCDVTDALPTKAFMRWQPEIQNSVAPAQPHGCTSATVDEKRRRKQIIQLHQRNRETPKPQGHGCTSAPHLESTMGGSPIRQSINNVTRLPPPPARPSSIITAELKAAMCGG